MLEKIGNMLSDFWDAVTAWINQSVENTFTMITDTFFWLLDKLMDLALFALNGLGSFAQFDPTSYFSLLPAEVINFMGLIGFGEALTIIMSAIGIRLVLQLVPFTRLGS